MKKNVTIITLIIIITGAFLIFIWRVNKDIAENDQALAHLSVLSTPSVKPDRIEKITITEGTTYGILMERASTSHSVATAVYEASRPLYDLVKIRSGRFINLVFNKNTDELKELIYKIDSEDELHVQKICTTTAPIIKNETDENKQELTSPKQCQPHWQAEIIPIPYKTKIKVAEGVVESSMYQAALDNDIDIRAIIDLANAFQWTIDFAIDPRVGDTFKFIYKERYLDGEYIMPGEMLAGKYTNDGQEYELYYFEESEENKGFFDTDGNSVQKMFLKAPVAYKYISSGYTAGKRYIPAFRIFTQSHMAIDYAAAAGTPVRSVGDGTIIYVGWKTSYGKSIGVHHNGTYSTNYSHLSGYAVKRGQKVKQGEIIGYVGSTGLSTGPHLHFEMVKHGVKINSLREILPPGKPIKEENRERFFNTIKLYKEMLNN